MVRPSPARPSAVATTTRVRNGILRTLLVALLLVFPVSADARKSASKEPQLIEVMPPGIPASRAVVLRARILDDSVAVRNVTFWVRQGRTAYQPVEGKIGREGAYEARMVWRGGTKAVHYFVDLTDVHGDLVQRLGSPMKAFQAYFSPESFKRKPTYGWQKAVFAAFVLAATLYLLNAMRRMDRWDRIRNFWLMVLAPLVPLRGHSMIRAIDRLLKRIPDSRLPEDVESPRLMLIGWINEIRETRIARWRTKRKRRREQARARV